MKHLQMVWARIGWLFSGRFDFLLVSLLLSLGLRPFLARLATVQFLTDVFFLVILLSAIRAASENRKGFHLALIIATPALALVLADGFVGLVFAVSPGHYFLAFFLTYALALILRHVLRQKRVTKDLITGAVCAYLLFGMLWGFAYYFLESTTQSSFAFASGLPKDFWTFIYFSFVTLATLGYGDVTPISPPACSLAILEALVGQLYLAILIARLVAIQVSDERKN